MEGAEPRTTGLSVEGVEPRGIMLEMEGAKPRAKDGWWRGQIPRNKWVVEGPGPVMQRSWWGPRSKQPS